jgi:two-component system chemotaxis response regulator CheB
VLFASIAENRLAPETLAIILTGMGKDGAEEMKVLHDQGARTLGEDRSSCVVYGMPHAARQLGAVECELPLDKISTALLHLLGR